LREACEPDFTCLRLKGRGRMRITSFFTFSVFASRSCLIPGVLICLTLVEVVRNPP
jgi:hypothetical protein